MAVSELYINEFDPCIKVSILFFCLFIKHQRYIISLHSIHITYIKQELNKKYVKKREGIGKNYCYDQSHDKWRKKNDKKVYFSLLIKYFPLLEYHVSNSSHISLKLKKKINYVMSIPIQINIGSIFSPNKFTHFFLTFRFQDYPSP